MGLLTGVSSRSFSVLSVLFSVFDRLCRVSLKARAVAGNSGRRKTAFAIEAGEDPRVSLDGRGDTGCGARMLEEDPANQEWREKYGRLLEEEMRIADRIRTFKLEKPKIARMVANRRSSNFSSAARWIIQF